jgi:hypothetical protein
MNKKELGSALRRGVVAGTIAGSVSGWAAFAAQAAVSGARVEPPPAVAPALPALPARPELAPLPNVGTVQATTTVVLPPVRSTSVAPLTKTRSS